MLTGKRKCSSSAEIRLHIFDFERHIASLVTFSARGPPGPQPFSVFSKFQSHPCIQVTPALGQGLQEQTKHSIRHTTYPEKYILYTVMSTTMKLLLSVLSFSFF